MGEDFQAGVCGSTWWNSPRGSIGFSPCLVGMNDFGSYGWPSHDLGEMKVRSSATREVPSFLYDQEPILFDHNLERASAGSNLIDTTSQMTEVSQSSTTMATTDWSQNLICGSGSNEPNYQSSMMQENMSSSSTAQDFSLHSSLPMSSSSYVYPSTVIDNLFADDQLPLENQPIDFPSKPNYLTKLNEISRSLSPLLTSLPNQQEAGPLLLTKNTPFWNASTSAPSDRISAIFPSSKSPMVEKHNFLNLKTKSNNGAAQDSKKSSPEPALKRPRIETPSPLPTFKVRKEKLGDRITALQQLVSPFGKTDTASVLQEAIEYIRFLHDQVTALSTPYKKNGAPIQQQQNNDNSKDSEGPKQDLRGRGLCLVPISSTFPVANETTVDFWTPTFGGTFR